MMKPRKKTAGKAAPPPLPPKKKTKIEQEPLLEFGPFYPRMTESHAHLALLAKKGLSPDMILERCFRSGLDFLLEIAVSEDRWAIRKTFSESSPRVRLSAGIHPLYCREDSPRPPARRLDEIQKQLNDPSTAALGEIGLDYYRHPESKNLQKDYFIDQLALAAEHGIPVIIHNREASSDLFEILRRRPLERPGILHCFSGTQDEAFKALDLGFMLSFAGNLTYKSAASLRKTAAGLPLRSLLIETDTPYLSPRPVRGRINHPGHLGYTLETLAEVRGTDPASLSCSLKENFLRLFPEFRASEDASRSPGKNEPA